MEQSFHDLRRMHAYGQPRTLGASASWERKTAVSRDAAEGVAGDTLALGGVRMALCGAAILAAAPC